MLFTSNGDQHSHTSIFHHHTDYRFTRTSFCRAAKNVKLDCGYRLDLVIEEKVIVEIKAISDTIAVHEAQLLSYLKLSGCKVGLLINFNVKLLKQGIRRIIN